MNFGAFKRLLAMARLDPANVAVTGGSIGDAAVASFNKRLSPAWLLLVKLRATIIGNGGTVEERDLLALRDPLDALIHSTVWPKLQELWVPVGNNLLAALCKLKGGTLTLTHANMVDGDYSRWLGLKGNGTTKDASTNFNASALTADWGFGVYPTGAISSSSDVLMGDAGNCYVGYAGANAKINGSAQINLERPNRFLAIQNKAGVGATSYYGGYANATTTAGAVAANTLRLLSYNNSFFSPNSVGGYAVWAPTLTAAELKILADFFEVSAYRLGRLGIVGNIVAAGDSNTAGQGVSSAQRWPALLAAAFNAAEVNYGAPGWSMSDNDNGGAAGRYITQAKVDRSKDGGVFLTVQLGTNDERYQVSLSNYAADFETWLGYQLDVGWKPGNIILVSPIAATDVLSNSTRQQQMRDVVKSMADKYRCLYVDAYALTVGQPTYLQGDALHLSVAGHAALATAVQNVICADAYSGSLPF